jgi:hypothetical protein
MILLSANNATTVLAAALTTTTTTIQLSSGTGANFPSPGVNEYFTLTLNDLATGDVFEICFCTARSGDNLTVIRAQEGTNAAMWQIGDFAYNTETAGSIAAARAFSATNTPILPFTIPAAHIGVTQILNATGTITLPNPTTITDGFVCGLDCVSSGATITVNTNSATVLLPTGAVTTTFTISGLASPLFLQWSTTSGSNFWTVVAAPPVFYPFPVPNLQVFTSSGSFTVPAGVTRISTEIWGGGGGAGGAANASGAGGGGGGGGFSEGVFTVMPGQTIAVTVGLGGTGGDGAQNGTTGGTTSFGSFNSATGGGGGGFGDGFGGVGGAGGSATGGTLNLPGGVGGPASFPAGGFQGSSFNGAGIPGGTGTALAQTLAGQFPGVGGQGGITVSSSQTQQGGNGAGGLVILEWWSTPQ